MGSLPVLAFGFFDPWLLWGLGLGAVPILIHMLYKRRYQQVPWAAMRFLMAAARKNSRRIRLEQLMLLTLRVLILVLVALALAQPYVESAGVSLDADQPTHRILVVDASFSMGYRVGELSRFERAKDVARQIVTDGRQGDAFQLVRVSDSAPTVVVAQPAFQQEPMLDEIERLALTQEPGDVLAAVRQIPKLLEDAPRLTHKEVCIISDLQSASWRQSGTRQAELQRLFEDVAKQARVTFIDLGQPDSPNVAVTRLDAEGSFVDTEQPVRVQSSVHNYGSAAVSRCPVELYVDDRLMETRQVDLPPDADTAVDFSIQLQTPGAHRVEVRVADDALPLDNSRYLALTAHDQLHVLLVNGRRSGRAEENATYYVETVLAPQTSRQAWQGFARPRVISEGELLATDLSLYDCVFLCNVSRIVPAEFDLLHAYVRSGGAIVLCLGDQVDADNYNQVLYRDGDGILPARLGDRRGRASEPSESSVVRFSTNDLSHPIVNPFEGNVGAGLETTLVFEYFDATLPEQGDAAGRSSAEGAADDSDPLPAEGIRSKVALWFDSGDPAVVEGRVESGRSILITTSLDNRWGPWPLQRSFPPLVHEILRFAVSGSAGDQRRLVGEPLILGFPMPAYGMDVSLQRPGGEAALEIAGGSNRATRLTFEETNLSGFYTFTLGPPLNRRELFAVNVDPIESDLHPVSEDDLQESVLAGVEFAYRTRWDDVERRMDVGLAERGSFSRWLLVFALCLIFVEQLMAWRFFYGFLALYSVTAAGFLRWAFAWSVGAGVLLAVIFVAGLAGMLLWSRHGQTGSLPWPKLARR